jgi:erythromycin esterase
MHKSLKICSMILFLSTSAGAQIRKYVLEHTTVVNSTEFSDTNYDDLKPLAESIGERRIVMLGELFHGDGESIKLKSRIVRFLHQQMGFNVLVFESDFFALNEGYDAFKNNKISFDSLLYLSVFPIWTQCQQLQELFGYIKKSTSSGNELVINGVDNRGVSGYGLRYQQQAIDSFLRSTQIPFVKAPDYHYFKSMLGKSYTLLYGKNKAALDSMIQLLPIVIGQLSEKYGTSDDLNTGFYLNVLNGLLINYKLSLHYNYSDDYRVHRKNHPLHDFQLAENLKWLATKKFPTDKIIVWAHNTHVEKGPVEQLTYRNYNSMGYLFTRSPQMLLQTYIIAITCYEGSGQLTTRDVEEKVTRPPKNSIESWLHTTGHRYAFTNLMNFRSNDNNASFSMKSYINTQSSQEWTKFYDGILYVNTAQPCTKKTP